MRFSKVILNGSYRIARFLAMPLPQSNPEFDAAAVATALAELQADLGLEASVGRQAAAAQGQGEPRVQGPLASSSAMRASKGHKVAAKSPAYLPTPELTLSTLHADAQPYDGSLEMLSAAVCKIKSRQPTPDSESLPPCLRGLVRGNSFLASQQMAAERREKWRISAWIREGQSMPEDAPPAEGGEVTAWKFYIDEVDIAPIEEPQLPLSGAADLFSELPRLTAFDSLHKCLSNDAGSKEPGRESGAVKHALPYLCN